MKPRMIDPDPDDQRGQPEVHSRSVDLQRDGILAHINRTAFHPLGFALAYDPATHEFALLGNGSEPWAFADDAKSRQKFADFWRLIHYLRTQ